MFTAVGNTLMLAAVATVVGFALGSALGFVAGLFRDTWADKLASFAAVVGVSVPHYWLGMVLVIVFSAKLGWLPATGAGPGGSAAWAWDWAHVRFLILPSLTMAMIPMGLIARTVRALVADTLGQEFVVGLRAKGLTRVGIFRHVVKNVAPTVLAVMGLQLGYLLGGSILIETVFAWPGTGLLLGQAIFQRDLPLLQGTILVLATFFVLLNLAVDLLQGVLDPPHPAPLMVRARRCPRRRARGGPAALAGLLGGRAGAARARPRGDGGGGGAGGAGAHRRVRAPNSPRRTPRAPPCCAASSPSARRATRSARTNSAATSSPASSTARG